VTPVRPNAEAEEEFRYYIHWYENESVGLGDRLWAEIQAALDLISERPAIGETVRRIRVRGTVRRVP
jgi:plasmid stabilization system protein ParE